MVAIVEERCIAARVRRLHRAVVSRYDDALRPTGITIGQLDMLVTLMELGPDASPRELGRALLMERSTVSRNLHRLQHEGLVRLDERDGRTFAVRLTRAGRRLVDRAYGPWSEVQARIREEIGADGLEALDLLVERIGKEED